MPAIKTPLMAQCEPLTVLTCCGIFQSCQNVVLQIVWQPPQWKHEWKLLAQHQCCQLVPSEDSERVPDLPPGFLELKHLDLKVVSPFIFISFSLMHICFWTYILPTHTLFNFWVTLGSAHVLLHALSSKITPGGHQGTIYIWDVGFQTCVRCLQGKYPNPLYDHWPLYIFLFYKDIKHTGVVSTLMGCNLI